MWLADEPILVQCHISIPTENVLKWVNLGDEYQKFLIFIALIIASDEGRATNLQ